MSLVTLKPGRRVTLAPFLDAVVVEVARDGGVKLELIATGPQSTVIESARTEAAAEQNCEAVAADSSRFFAEFA